MSTRMLLEGTDIRALLQQVRDSYGPEARIVHAERIRSGGMGGFFAKQRYEVTVEVDADAATTASASAIARSIHEELAAARDSADSSAVGVQAAPAHAAVQPVAPSVDQHVAQHGEQHVAPPAAQPVAPSATEAVVSPAAQAAAAHAAALRAPLVSPDPLTTPIVTIDATTPPLRLEQPVAAVSTAAPVATAAPTVPTHQVAMAPAVAQAAVAAAGATAPAPAPAPVPAPVPTPAPSRDARDAGGQRAAIDLVLDAVTAAQPHDDATLETSVQRRPFVPPSLAGEELPLERATRDATGVVVPRPALTKVGPALEEPAPVNELAARLEAQRDAALGASTPAAPGATDRAPAQSAAQTVVPGRVEQDAADDEPTSLLTEPAALADRTSVDEPVEVIAPVLRLTTAPDHQAEAAPTAPVVAAPLMPRRPGDLLVLLGDPVASYAAALAMAAGTRIPATHVRVVSDSTPVPGLPEEQRVHDVLEARLAGAQLAMQRAAGIVVIDAPLGLVADPFGQDWVGDIIDALDATAVWAVVDATRRTEDVARWLAVLPEVTGLVVHDLALTSDPEGVHTLGVPVAIVDGKPVSALSIGRSDDGLSSEAVREAAMLAHPASHRRSS